MLFRSERRLSERMFAEGSNCVIVATSAMELGIDVGDLDRVIQIDSPGTVSAFMQRMGKKATNCPCAENANFGQLTAPIQVFRANLCVAACLLPLWEFPPR